MLRSVPGLIDDYDILPKPGPSIRPGFVCPRRRIELYPRSVVLNRGFDQVVFAARGVVVVCPRSSPRASCIPGTFIGFCRCDQKTSTCRSPPHGASPGANEHVCGMLRECLRMKAISASDSRPIRLNDGKRSP